MCGSPLPPASKFLHYVARKAREEVAALILFLNFGLWDGICLTSSTQIVVTYSSELRNTASTESTDTDFLLLNLGQENEISNYFLKKKWSTIQTFRNSFQKRTNLR